MVKINGQSLEVEGLTITQYLESTSYKINHIAIERNGEIVPKGLYNQTILKADDVIEVVSFVGGG